MLAGFENGNGMPLPMEFIGNGESAETGTDDDNVQVGKGWEFD